MATLSNALIVIFIISFILQSLVPGYRRAFLFDSDIVLFEPWRFFTATLLHAFLLHLLVNIYGLYMIGNALETKITKLDLLKILFFGSAIGYLFQWITYSYDLDNIGISLGSSTGISALLAVSAVIIPKTNVKVLFIPIMLRDLAVIFFAIEIIAWVIGNTLTYHEAHLVGGLFGLAYYKFLMKK